MKKISVCIPCYNEEENIIDCYEQVSKVLKTLAEYDYEIIFEDNDSKDKSQQILRKLAEKDKKVKVIINMRNFGPDRSGKNCTMSASGDAIITMCCDLQEPTEMLPEFIHLWEQGHLIVWGQKTESEENKIKYFLRSVYYWIIDKFSDYPQYKQTIGWGVMDKSVLETLKKLDWSVTNGRHMIAELGYPVKLVPYKQQVRKKGKSTFNVWRYLDFAITSLVSTSGLPLRMMTVTGVIGSFFSFLMGAVYLIYKIICWDTFTAGVAPIVIAVFFIGSIQLLFTGLIGEYLHMILKVVLKRPLVIEKERINFD